MTVFLLIRHAAHELLGRTLAGRMPGVHLSEDGRRQAEQLADRLCPLPIGAIYSSPLERTQETAQPLAARCGLDVQLSDLLSELEFGEWTGRDLSALDGTPLWHRFNVFRSGTRPPGGELMVEAQTRAVAELGRLSERHPDGLVAVVSHSDIIKAVLAFYLGMPLDLFLRLEISPASVSILEMGDYGPKLLRLNDTGELPHLG